MIPVGLIIWIVFLAIGGLAVLIPILFRVLCQRCIAPLLTPRGHRRYGEYKESEGYDELLRDNFGVTPVFSSNAMKRK